MTGNDGRWRRLHPIAMVVSLVNAVRDAAALFAMLAAIVLPNRDSSMIVAIVAVAAVLLVAWVLVTPLVRWCTTAYLLGEDGVTLRSGVFNRTRMTIAYDHIHTVSSRIPFYMRPFDVVTLQVTAAGSTDSDITLTAVPASLQVELESLRQQADAETATSLCDDANAEHAANSPMAAPDQGMLVFRASTRDILVFAITDLGMFAALLALIGVIEQVRDLLPNQWVDSLGDAFVHMALSNVLMLMMMIVAVAVVLAAISVVTSLLQFHGFEVWRRGDDLMVVRGAITRHITTIDVTRIRTVTIRRSLARRAFHLCSVRLGLAAANKGDDSMSDTNVLPVIGDERVYAVLGRMLPEWRLAPPEFHRTGRGLLRYFLITPTIAMMAGCVAVAVWSAVMHNPMLLWWLCAPAAIGLFWMSCRWLKAHTEGYALVTDREIVASGARMLTIVTLFTARSRVQSIERSTTMWRAPRGIESLSMPLYVANGDGTLRFTALRSADADTLARWAGWDG